MAGSRTALVTGVSRGLGRSAAWHLTRAGTGVIGTYRQGRQEAEELVEEVAASGGRLVLLPLDLAAADTYPDFVAAVGTVLEQEFASSRLDALVNNAGIGTFAPYVETTREQFDELVDVNLRAPYFLTQALLPLLGDGSRVLNMTTAVTRSVVAGMSAYAATKGAVEVMTRYQAVELAERGIRVNALMGGAVDTGFAGGIMRTEQVRELAAHQIALGRIATSDDIAGAVPAILSDAFQWATGRRLHRRLGRPRPVSRHRLRALSIDDGQPLAAGRAHEAVQEHQEKYDRRADAAS